MITLTGKIINDVTRRPIEGVRVSYSFKNNVDKHVNTNKSGIYEINISEEEGEISNKIFFKKNGFLESYIISSTSGGELRNTLPVISLIPQNYNKEKLKSQISNIPKDVYNKISDNIKNDILSIKSIFSQSIQKIFMQLIPIVVSLLLEFGIKNINDSKTQCPSKDDLQKIIKKRNNIVKALNTMYKMLNALVVSSSISLSLTKVMKTVQKVLINLPTPLGNTVPASLIHRTQEKIKKFQKNIDTYERVSRTVIIFATLLRSAIKSLLDHLSVLDFNIYECYKEINSDPNNPIGFELSFDLINQDIIDSHTDTNNGSNDNLITHHNGFKIEVINLDHQKIDGIFRRQAVAINPQGVIVLRGEPSFSYNDEILKQELIFSINTQNLKAY